MKWTIIINSMNGKFSVGCTKDVSKFMDEKRALCNKGYWHTKTFREPCRIVFLVKGDYEAQIRAFGSKKFLKMMHDYDPLNDALNRLIQ